MFVSHARVRIVGLGPKSKKRRFTRRRLAIKEVIQMPCLIPTLVTVFLGLAAVAGGAGMSVVGYIPSPTPELVQNNASNDNAQPSSASASSGHTVIGTSAKNSSDSNIIPPRDSTYYMLKTCSYIGPLFMAVGLFAMIVSCVFYCEILDKYSILVPDKRSAIYTKDELYEIIVGEMKKSYAQTLLTAYTKAAERSMIVDNKSMSGDFIPEPHVPTKPIEPISLEQQIDIECEGYTPSPPIPNKRYSVIQARIQRLKSEDNWLKTSSLPNIRRSEQASIKRVGRLRAAKNHSLSCDYTMDEARLRRKSMMLRSIILGHSSSSGELHQRRRSRRFSSTKILPSENTMSLEEMSQLANISGSFPLTRLIQRRGTFACGDMRTRRMKFLLLLQASESKEKISDTISIDGRTSHAGIRRNSFIPYTTCDRFIADEEKKHIRERRTSVNPFSSANRHGNQQHPAAALRRHSFFPIRRDDKIYVENPNEQRRHSFNPAAINNKYEYSGKMESRRGSFNPDASYDGSRRASYVPLQKSNFLQVPGFETDPILTERRPSDSQLDVPSGTFKPAQNRSDSQFLSHKQSGPSLMVPSQNIYDGRMVERRHSYQPPPVQQSSLHNEAATLKVPKIVISSEANNRFLSVPHEQTPEERRHSFNVPPSTTNLPSFASTAVPSRHIERPIPQRISFQLSPDNPSSPSSSSPNHPSAPYPFPGSSYPHASLTASGAKPSKPTPQNLTTSESQRPSGFKQEMVVFSPLPVPGSRSVSPVSNVSCCGSERVGSERSSWTARTTSLSSDRTNRTVTPLSGLATDSMNREESLERPPSPIDLHPVDNEEDSHYKPEHSGISSKSPYSSSTLTTPSIDTGGDRSTAAFTKSRLPFGHRHSRFRTGPHVVDSPASTSSGPATLHPTVATDINAALYRSQSASAIPTGEDEGLDPSFISYATLSPSASTARPSVKVKSVRSKHKTEEKS